jgi:hypothetical protein
MGELTKVEDWLMDDKDRGVSGVDECVHPVLGVPAEVEMEDRVEVERGRDLTVGLGGTEESELESVGRERDLADGLRC